jgi:hypothetical protein
MRRYECYQPTVREGLIYSGAFGMGEFAYNHMVSIERFAGRYYAAWSANAHTHREGQPGQINVLATSDDFVRWTQPLDLGGPDLSENPVREPNEILWQPELLNVNGDELWCLWSFGKEGDTVSGRPGWGDPDRGKGLWLSRLGATAGAKWRHRKIMDLVDADGLSCAPFVSQNPFLCSTGRIVAPLTLVHDPRNPRDVGEAADIAVRMFNACAWTDDNGASWHISNPISRVDEPYGQWEPHFWEQADGTIRGIMRNFDTLANRKKPQPSGERQLTVAGGTSEKGKPIRFEKEPQYAWIETGRTRTQVFRCEDGLRWCMLGGDAHTPLGARSQCAVYFSRTGAMDFVAGPRYSPRHVYATYSQGLAHDGKLLTAFTTTENRHTVWRILTAVLDPAPRADKFYIWPREKYIESDPSLYTEPPKPKTADGRNVLHFLMRGSAGVEIDPVDFEKGQRLRVRMAVKVVKTQHRGNLVFCSLGDRLPLRLAMPGNRPGKLYAYGREEWQYAGDLPVGEWHTIEVVFGADVFEVALNGGTRTFDNPLRNPAPRLYLGSGYETDEHPANDGAEFLLDLDTFGTDVDKAQA